MSDRVIRDRRDAGQPLAGLLDRYRGRLDVVVLGLPRGGVPVASEVARALGAPLDVFVVCKLDVPGREELAMGAIARAGVIFAGVEQALGALRAALTEAASALAGSQGSYPGVRPRRDP